jgi:nucleoid DNA-binding protein
MAKTMNKDALVEALLLHSAFEGKTKKATKEFVEDFFTMISDSVANGDTVSIASFGKFEPFVLANGVTKPKFRPFKDFKDAVAK